MQTNRHPAHPLSNTAHRTIETIRRQAAQLTEAQALRLIAAADNTDYNALLSVYAPRLPHDKQAWLLATQDSVQTPQASWCPDAVMAAHQAIYAVAARDLGIDTHGDLYRNETMQWRTVFPGFDAPNPPPHADDDPRSVALPHTRIDWAVGAITGTIVAALFIIAAERRFGATAVIQATISLALLGVVIGAGAFFRILDEHDEKFG